MAKQPAWDNELEKEFKETIHKYFDEKISNELNSKNALNVGDNLGQLLKNSEEDIVKIITPRAVKKWASHETLPLWEKFLENKQISYKTNEI